MSQGGVDEGKVEVADIAFQGMRMPTLAWGPTLVSAGKVSERPSQLHDWTSTFLDFAGASRPARLDGVSLMPTRTGKGAQGAVFKLHDKLVLDADYRYGGMEIRKSGSGYGKRTVRGWKASPAHGR